MATNPLTRLDYPDPDVIRVGNTYYMVSTTMYFMPGCEILRSYDLMNWEHACFVYDIIEDAPTENLTDGKHAYGSGMWAAPLRYHNGTFYVVFVANDLHKTFLYSLKKEDGILTDSDSNTWAKKEIEGFYHDCSLLFDDGSAYLIYGNTKLYLTELNEDLTAPKEGGLHRILADSSLVQNGGLGYEGSHMYKINGKYYVFVIHWPVGRRRIETCLIGDSLTGEFKAQCVLDDDMGYCGSGCAQGGIVDTPSGEYYAIVFQDRGSVGRIPVLTKVDMSGEFPVFAKVDPDIQTESLRPGYEYAPLYGSDDFKRDAVDGKPSLPSYWQWNHNPVLSYVAQSKENGLTVTTDIVAKNHGMAHNVLTQRLLWPGCTVEVTVDGSGLKNGDYAGLCAFQSCYAMIALARKNDKLYIVMHERKPQTDFYKEPFDTEPGTECVSIPFEGNKATLRFKVDFMNMKDTVQMYYKLGDLYMPCGPEHKLYFKLDYFTGCRAGLFVYSTKKAGGSASFTDFVYSE